MSLFKLLIQTSELTLFLQVTKKQGFRPFSHTPGRLVAKAQLSASFSVWSHSLGLFGNPTAFVVAYIVQVLKPFNLKQRQPLSWILNIY